MYVDRVQYGFAYFLSEMKYLKILRAEDKDHNRVGHTTIKGLKLAIRQKKAKEGIFKCYCPNGNVHTWEIMACGTHTCAGRTTTKGKVGKGVVVINYAAIFLKNA